MDIRAGNSLIGFLNELLFFAKKISEWAIRSRSLISSERPKQMAHGCSFLVSDLSDTLTLLIFGEQPEQFAYIAHWKRGNERITHFFNLKNVYKTY